MHAKFVWCVKTKTRLSFVGVRLSLLTTPHPITFLIFTAFIWPHNADRVMFRCRVHFFVFSHHSDFFLSINQQQSCRGEGKKYFWVGGKWYLIVSMVKAMLMIDYMLCPILNSVRFRIGCPIRNEFKIGRYWMKQK